MPPEIAPFVTALIGAFAGAIAGYVAIRSDLADHAARIENLETGAQTERARMDNLLMVDRRKG